MNAPLRIGIAGFGKMGKIRARHMSARQDSTLVGVYEPEGVDRDKVPPSARVVASVDELFTLSLDALFVCAINNVAAEYSRRGLEAGIHVFCEKPPARNSTELVTVIEAEKRSGLVLKYGFNHRLHYSVMEAKRLIDSGRMGRLLWIRGVYGKAGSIDYGSNWRNFRAYSGGGILMDQGIHMIDLLQHLTGLPFDVASAQLSRSYWDVEVEDNAFVTLRSGTVIATLHSSANQWRHKFLMEFHFEDGYVNLDGILSESRSYTPETLVVGRREFEDITFAMGKPAEQTTWYEYDDSWKLEMDEFVRAIREGASFNGSSADALSVLRLVETIYATSGFYHG
jgi:predicted dehydrogenase